MPTVEVDGQRLFYRKQDADQPRDDAPLVLVHGAGGLSLNWPPQLRRLRGRTVYALDLPGHGLSTGQSLTTIASYRSWVVAFADALNLSQFVLAGHSMGGAIALDMTLAEPTRLAGLILVGTGARLPVADRLLEGLENRYTETATWLVDLLFAAEADQRMKEEFRTHLLSLDPALVLGDFRACDDFDVVDRIGDINVATLIVCGTADKMTPLPASEFLHAHLPNSQLSLVENAGHMVMLEQPAAVAAEVDAFLGSDHMDSDKTTLTVRLGLKNENG